MMVCDKVGNVTVVKLGGTAEAFLSLCPFVGDEGFFLYPASHTATKKERIVSCHRMKSGENHE